MKNVFKFLGIALLASSLVFASCGKDEETETPGTENNGGNNNGGGNGNGGGNNGGSNGAVTVTLGSTVNFTTPQDSLAAYTANNKAYFFASNGRSARIQGQQISYYFPCFRADMPTTVGQYDTASSSMVYYTGEFYRFANQYQANDVAEYPDWLPEGNITTNVTAFDATALKITASMNGPMLYYYGAFYAYQTDQNDTPWADFLAAATRENITVAITNVKLQSLGKGNLVVKPIK